MADSYQRTAAYYAERGERPQLGDTAGSQAAYRRALELLLEEPPQSPRRKRRAPASPRGSPA